MAEVLWVTLPDSSIKTLADFRGKRIGYTAPQSTTQAPAFMLLDAAGIRPDEVQLIFGRKIYSNTDRQFSTKVVTRGVDVIVNVFYKHSRITEYLKEGRALRIETVCNSPTDLVL